VADPNASRNGHDRGETARHDRHDVELVAGLIAGDLEGGDLRRAETLVTQCDLCEALADDLRTIQAGLRESATWTASAPRDFRLAPEHAASLQRRSFSGLLAQVRAALAPAARPLGASLATLGLVVILVGTVAPSGSALPAALGGASGAGGAAPQAAASAGATKEAVPGGGFTVRDTGGPASTDSSAAQLAGGTGPEATTTPRDMTEPPPAAPSATEAPTARASATGSPTAAPSGAPALPGSTLQPFLLGGGAVALILGIGLLAWRPRRLR
jgi:hypothetical protein